MVEDSSEWKPTVAGRIPQDTYNRLEDYCEDRDLSKADVIRRSIEDHLDREELQEDMWGIRRAEMDATLFEVIQIGILAMLGILILAEFGVI